MSEVDDIAISLAKHYRSGGWLRTIVASAISAALSIAGTGWAARGMLDDINQKLALQSQELRYLREHVDDIGHVSIEAKGKAETAINMMYASKGGYPPGVKP